jgi:hypothetical protein
MIYFKLIHNFLGVFSFPSMYSSKVFLSFCNYKLAYFNKLIDSIAP